MTSVEPHEKLKARGDLCIFSHSMGKAAFVSHQWVATHHPDPEFKQMKVVKRLLSSSGSISVDITTESLVRTAKPLRMQEFQAQALFFWYDYFSCPQLERRHGFGADDEDGSKQAHAINSIPAYVTNCHFFLALCPVIDCFEENKVLSPLTWSRRGWCRVERIARELSEENTWVLIQSSTFMEVVGTLNSFPAGMVGEGNFTVQEDKHKLGPVMRQIIVQNLKQCLRSGDLPGFRRYFNLNGVYLRELQVESFGGFLPSCDGRAGNAVAEFLHQNGFRRIGEVDKAGWRPLHYAALGGNAEVLKGMLEQRANVNWRTSKDVPAMGNPPWMSALDIASGAKHYQAARLLIEARAHLEGGLLPSLMCATFPNDAEIIRLLCDAGSNPLHRNLIGNTAYLAAAGHAATEALEELVAQVDPGPLELSRALQFAAAFRGGSAKLVHRLIGLRADINFQIHMPRDAKSLGRLLAVVKSLQHRFGKTSVLTFYSYHLQGISPLMQAIQSAQFEAAAALISFGAKLDLRNGRNWTAADFAKGQSIPHFLQLGLQGDPSECHTVCALALADSDEGCVSVRF